MTWEYKVEKLELACVGGIGIQRPMDTYKMLEERLNQLGQEGWELVEISPAFGRDCETILGVYYFKRQKPTIGSKLPNQE